MFNFKRNSSSTSSPSKRPQLLPPRPSFAQGDSLSTRSGSPTHSIHSQASYGGPGSPLGSPRLFTPTPGYHNGPTSSTGYFPSLPLGPQREWTEESLGQLRKSVLDDLKKMEEVVTLFKERKEVIGKLMGLERDLAGGLRRLIGAAAGGKDGTEGDMVAKALHPCSATSQDHSVVLSKLHKHLVRQVEKLEMVVSKHSRAVKKEYNALDEVILIKDKRMNAAEKPLRSESSKPTGIGAAHEKYLKTISGLVDDSTEKKRSTANSVSVQHTIAIAKFTSQVCQNYQIAFDGVAEITRVSASKIGDIRYWGILTGEHCEISPCDLPEEPEQTGSTDLNDDGDETLKWKNDFQRQAMRNGTIPLPSPKVLEDRVRPHGKRSMPVPPTNRTSNHPPTSSVATLSSINGTESSSVLSTATTSNQLSPRTPLERDKYLNDFFPGAIPTVSPSGLSSFELSIPQDKRGHRSTASVSDRMKQFEMGSVASSRSHASNQSSDSSARSGMPRPSSSHRYSLPAVSPLRLPVRDPPDATPRAVKEKEVPRDYSRLPVPTSDPVRASSNESGDNGGDRVRRLSGLFERKNENGVTGRQEVKRLSPNPSRHGAGCMCPSCFDQGRRDRISTIRPVPNSPSLRPGLPSSRQSTSSIHSYSDVEVRQPSPKRSSQKIEQEIAELLARRDQ